MIKTNRLKVAIAFVMAFFLSMNSGLSVLSQARAAGPQSLQATAAQDFFSSISDQIESGVKKCKAIAQDVANVAGDILGPLKDSAWSCVKDIFKGAWSSTGGAVLEGVKAVGAGIGTAAGCVAESAYCANQLASSGGGIVSGAVDGAASAVSAAASCAGDPIGCARNVATKVRNTAAFVSNLIDKVKASFSDLSAEQIRDMVCNILGSLGGPILLSIATGGAAAGLLGANIGRIVLFLQKLSTVGPIGTMMKLMNLPFEVLMKLSAPVTDRIIALLKKDISLSPKIKEAVMSCSLK